jgi:hypothetical protein
MLINMVIVLSFFLPQPLVSVSRIHLFSSGDKLITLPARADTTVERFLESCSHVVIHVASGDRNKVFSPEDVTRDGFKENRNSRPPDFVLTFWEDMVDKLDIGMYDSANVDSCVRHPFSDIFICEPLTCFKLDPYKLDPYKLFETFPQTFRERLHHVTSRDEGQDVEPNGQDILSHLLSTASFEKKFWSESAMVRPSEEDIKYIFFNRIANSSSLPNGAKCLLYVGIFTSHV